MEEQNKHVYLHRRADDPSMIFYVGIGNDDRPDSNDRTEDWAWVEEFAGGKIVEYVHRNLTKAEARSIERDLIARYLRDGMPICNGTEGGEIREGLPVYCIELNQVFDSISEASKVTGIKPDRISSVCRGRTMRCRNTRWRYVPLGLTDDQLEEWKRKQSYDPDPVGCHLAVRLGLRERHRRVVDLVSGVLYTDLKTYAEDVDLPYSKAQSLLDNRYSRPNSPQIATFKECFLERDLPKFIQKELSVRSSVIHGKAVCGIDLNPNWVSSGKVFPSVFEAVNWLRKKKKVDASPDVIEAAAQISGEAYGFMWFFDRRTENFTAPPDR